MQDNGHRMVAAALIALAGTDDVYKVVEADEILERLPADTSMDKQALSAVIRDLRGMGYLDVKYFTPDEYCLLVSPRAAELTAREEERAKEEPADPRPIMSAAAVKRERTGSGSSRISVFFAALSGSLIGGVIVAVIAILLQKFAL